MSKSACSKLSLLEVLYGILIARTLSGPSAAAARQALSAESTPPESPTTTRLTPTLQTSLVIKAVRICFSKGGFVGMRDMRTVYQSSSRSVYQSGRQAICQSD